MVNLKATKFLAAWSARPDRFQRASAKEAAAVLASYNSSAVSQRQSAVRPAAATCCCCHVLLFPSYQTLTTL